MKKLSDSGKILIGMLGGLGGGLLLGIPALKNGTESYLANGIFRIAGDLFINSFRLIVVPVVLVSLARGVAEMPSPRSLGRIGGKGLLFYLTTTACAIALGLACALLFRPGAGIGTAPPPAAAAAAPAAATSDWVQTIIDIIPTQLTAFLSGGNMLQVIFVAILCGLALALGRERTVRLRELLAECDAFNAGIIAIIMKFAPYGVFALMVRSFAELGAHGVLPVAKYLLCVGFALAVQLVVVDAGLLKLLGRLPVRIFFRKYLDVMLLAFSTSSSNAVLPENLRILETRLGVSERIAGLLLPLGATINMNGTAIMQGVATVFVAQLYGIELSWQGLLTVVFTATLASVGTAGVPGVGSIMLVMVLQSVNLPVAGIALLLGVDRILDMLRTVLNVTGDAVCACIIARGENELDEKVYRAARS